MYCAATDIHDMKNAEARLHEADRRKNHFLAMLGHELLNPLAAIRAGLTLLSSEKAKAESKAMALPIVLEQTRHMERLVGDLLDVTRIVQGRIQVRKEPMALGDAVRGALDMLHARLEADGFSVKIDEPAEALRLIGDKVRLTQVFVNLIGNAAKYSGDSRRIEISVCQKETRFEIKVRDYGLGISREVMPYVFDPFVQAKPGLTLQEGVGLGLAVVRELVRLHGGEVNVFSDGEGRGSEFVVKLPATS
jgi:signal transduction histidine kinase